MSSRRVTKSKAAIENATRAYRARKTLSDAVRRGTVVSAAEFKASCLSLMEEVRHKGHQFIITKHNEPVARLVPVIDEAGSRFIGRGAGVIAVHGDIVAPTAPDWEEGADI